MGDKVSHDENLSEKAYQKHVRGGANLSPIMEHPDKWPARRGKSLGR